MERMNNTSLNGKHESLPDNGSVLLNSSSCQGFYLGEQVRIPNNSNNNCGETIVQDFSATSNGHHHKSQVQQQQQQAQNSATTSGNTSAAEDDGDEQQEEEEEQEWRQQQSRQASPTLNAQLHELKQSRAPQQRQQEQQHHVNEQEQQKQQHVDSNHNRNNINPFVSAGMSLSTIGFGIHAGPESLYDATKAAIRALQDALNRSVLQLCHDAWKPNAIQVTITLGVPAQDTHVQQPQQQHEPMKVDLKRVMNELPSVAMIPMTVVIGGMKLKGKHREGKDAICTCVACVSVDTTTTPAPTTTPMDGLESYPQKQSPAKIKTSLMSPAPTPPPPPPPPTMTTTNVNRTVKQQRPLTSSMDMLARISEAVREKEGATPAATVAVATNAPTRTTRTSITSGPQPVSHGFHGTFHPPQHYQQQQQQPDASLSSSSSSKSATVSSVITAAATSLAASANNNIRKLPPGITAKKNKRQFVQHNYTDRSTETPTAHDGSLLMSTTTTLGTTPTGTRSYNPTFPVKLYEALHQIEQDGFQHVISWQPHGRSFKIHKQQEFANLVLPKYFCMTKKSSFLRQLNLYQFSRLSAGQDKGAYYHEYFLRGMKFLCRRMQRNKINGNGIRAAGNPDQEPNFYLMPHVPLVRPSTSDHPEMRTESSSDGSTTSSNNSIQ